MVVPATAAAPGVEASAAGRWIVELAPGSGVARTNAGIRGALGMRPEHVFRSALHGFSARLTAAQRQRLLRDPRVAAVTPDRPIRAAFQPQQVQPGVERVRAPDNPDRDNPPLDVDIAIIDTGIQPDHPDLNVVGGYNCTDPGQSEGARREPSAWRDGGFGHGTHVAGIAAARDNNQGVAGVAAGARLWSVRVLDHAGLGYWSWIICGIDWVAGRDDPDAPGRPLFEVANMSLAGGGADDGDCGYTNADLLHRAVCRLERAGVTIVAAAGNEEADTRGYVPAAYDEVIAVSAMADYDGRPGGLAGRPSGCAGRDDGFASFSNFGADVDLIAPGVCVLSTLPGSRYGRISGTSMATPHVAGGAALFHVWQARHGRARPDPQDVRAALQAAATLDWRTGTDADSGTPGSEREKALSVAAFDAGPSFRIGATPAARRVLATGTATYDVWTARIGGFDAAVALSVAGLPGGASWSVEPDPHGGGAGWRRIVIELPGPSAAGSHQVEIQADGGGISRSLSVTLNVDSVEAAASGAPRLGLRAGVGSDVVALPARVDWPAVAGADAYEVQASRDGGPWTAVVLSSPTQTSAPRKIWPGSSYRHRLRVRDNGTWGPWQLGAASVAVPRYAPYDGVDLSGAWAIAQKPGSYSELPAYSKQAGASATLEFVGRSVSWISIRGPKRGKARVYVDGALASTVDLYAGSNLLRSVVFSRSWTEAGPHTIEIVVRGTSGRPRVDVDAVVVIRDQ